MITKEPVQMGKVRVTFSMPAGIWADTIHLVGDFNNWNQTATPLRLDDQGWNVSLELDEDKSYQYRYLVNGTDWYNDWRADHYVPNEYGGDNSVVVTSVQREEAFEVSLQSEIVHAAPELETEIVYRGNHTNGHKQKGRVLARSYGGRTSAVAAMKNTT